MADTDRAGEMIAGRYKILRMLERGGMGQIYQAEQVPLGQIVVIKVLSFRAGPPKNAKSARKRFLREAATLGQLKHPNTVRVFDYGELDDGTVYMAMEFVEGETLGQVLHREGALDERRVLRLAFDISRSLGEAHELGVVHRDLKPANLMLQPMDDGEIVRVLDFGIAKILNVENPHIKPETLTDGIIGTPQYMAPEQITLEPVDGRTDLYTLGVVLYELLAGVLPFSAKTPYEYFSAHVHQEPPPINGKGGREVHPVVEALVMRLLEKDPANRPQSARELREEIKAVQTQLTKSEFVPALSPVPNEPRDDGYTDLVTSPAVPVRNATSPAPMGLPGWIVPGIMGGMLLLSLLCGISICF